MMLMPQFTSLTTLLACLVFCSQSTSGFIFGVFPSSSSALSSLAQHANIELLASSRSISRGVTALHAKNKKEGLFSPAVKATRAVIGKEELTKLRGKVIAEHSKVIAAFVDTSESKFGKIALKALFEFADKNGDGVLTAEEIESACNALGFAWIDQSKSEQLVARADVDENSVIDFEEFVATAPKTLRTNLVKLAKENGNDLGFLV